MKALILGLLIAMGSFASTKCEVRELRGTVVYAITPYLLMVLEDGTRKEHTVISVIHMFGGQKITYYEIKHGYTFYYRTHPCPVHSKEEK